MQIDLTDKTWGRLYGPYGNRSVNNLLQTLAESWDGAAAQELFWEELHHQESVYPATYASLPWLIEISRSQNEAFVETYLFLSHVVYCACTDGGTQHDGTTSRVKYHGLSTNITHHQHRWIPQDEWLTDTDLPVLIKLEKWFSENYRAIATRCLSLVGPDTMSSAYAIEGFASASGSPRLASSTQMFASGEDVDFISRELGDYDGHG